MRLTGLKHAKNGPNCMFSEVQGLKLKILICDPQAGRVRIAQIITRAAWD
ncbi:hypothetical protein HanPSC8_Chr17g0783911 [Helianthus annuus]|nr:hypothetical protein HanPSC8_Chr17g0783911 [Helianthus annuus]